MSDTLGLACCQESNVSDQLLIIRRLQKEAKEYDAKYLELIQQAQEWADKRDACIQNYKQIAELVLNTGYESPGFVMKGYKMKEYRKLDVAKLRQLRPDIYKRANPHVDPKIICEILQAAKPHYSLQDMAREMDPERYDECSKVLLDDLDKATGSKANTERLLVSEGIISIGYKPDGEPQIISKMVTEAKPRARLVEVEEEEEE